MADGELKAALLMRLRSVGIRSIGVLRAMESVPRDAFVPHRFLAWTGRDIALPIGCGQTTAEPSFLARAIEALACTEQSRVLEIGSGSGFVTALLARLAARVFGVERYRSLAETAQARLTTQGVAHASVRWGDGLEPPPPDEPFDRIMIHAALDAPPTALIDRLTPEGVMVYPLRNAGGRQDLVKVVRTGYGTIAQSRVCGSRLQSAVPGRALTL